MDLFLECLQASVAACLLGVSPGIQVLGLTKALLEHMGLVSGRSLERSFQKSLRPRATPPQA